MNDDKVVHVAIDVGGSGGKVFYGEVRDSLSFGEIYRFDNWPVRRDGHYFWNIDRIIDEIVTGLEKVEDEIGRIDSLGVDSCGVDFGLIEEGELIEDPYFHRDPSMVSTVSDILDEMSKQEIFERTGISHWESINSLWEYYYLSREEPQLLDRADNLVMIPQLISYLLGGGICGEVTVASTTQMLDPRDKKWEKGLLRQLDLPVDILPEIRKPGTKIGSLDEDISGKIDSEPKIILPASHDTASAVVGMPLEESSRAFLSSGSWLIEGVEIDEPCFSFEAYGKGASNELGFDDTVRLLKNTAGFFLLEKCRKEWKEKGGIYKYRKLLERASEENSLNQLIDPDDQRFTIKESVAQKVSRYCRETDQRVPKNEGSVTRTILESIALKSAIVLEELMDVTGERSERLNLGGGGVRNELFCRFLSSALDMPVRAGPVEAAGVGNIIIQARANSRIDGVEEGRKLLEESFEFGRYQPENPDRCERAKSRMKNLF